MTWLSFSDRHLFLLAVLMYGISTLYSVFLWRKGFREDNRLIYLLLVAGFSFHTAAMGERGSVFGRCPVNNIYEATVFLSWALVVAYLAIGFVRRFRFLGAFGAPLLLGLGVFALMPPLDPPYGDQPVFTGGWISVHASLILLSYGTFGLSSVAGLMYLSQAHDLKFHKLRAITSRLPSIQRLERVMTRLLFAGFLLLTLGLVVGAVAIKPQPGTKFAGDPKVLWSMFVWAAYGVLLVVHWRFGQVGRRFAWGTVAAFAFILLTFWGTNLASAIHHP